MLYVCIGIKARTDEWSGVILLRFGAYVNPSHQIGAFVPGVSIVGPAKARYGWCYAGSGL
jgi:hypothetical protein